MWVFCGGMQRSGSTLQFQVTARLVEEAGLGKRVEWVKPERFPALRDRYASYPRWKVFKNHHCTEEMRSEFERGNALAVYVFRDLRDVCVSAMKKYSMSFDQLWDSGFLDHCLDQFARWTSLPRVLVSRYEEMITDLPGEVERIAEHLGIALGRARCEEIARDHAVERQLDRIEEAKRRGRLQQGFANGPLYDPETMLHTNHFTGGEIGAWSTVLSTEDVALIEDRARNWLAARGYGLSLGTFERTWLKLRSQPKKTGRAAQRMLGRGLTAIRGHRSSRS